MTLTLDPIRTAAAAAAEAGPGGARQASTVILPRPGAPAPVYPLAEARTRRRIVRAARELLAVADYAAVDFTAVAQVAGVRPADVSRRFATRTELTLAALQAPPALGPVARVRLAGVETVERFLEFWETGENAGILTNVLRAAMSDGRVRREVEDVLSTVLFLPLAAGLGTTDAGPRARLVSAALVGLAVTRYVLREEPLCSADHETIAVWMGPSIDCYLCGALGA